MDVSDIVKKLDLSQSKFLIRKAEELRRLSDLLFDSSGEICKAVICLEIAASRLGVLFDRQGAITLSGMSEKAYNRSYDLLQNGLGVDYKERFINSLPASRRASADFTRPIFTATAFYLCAKKHKLKVDNFKLIELSGACESEFSSIYAMMFLGSPRKRNVIGMYKGTEFLMSVPQAVFNFQLHMELPGALPGKRKAEDGGYILDDGLEVSSFKRRKQTEEHEQAYQDCRSDVIESNEQTKYKAIPLQTLGIKINKLVTPLTISSLRVSAREPHRLPGLNHHEAEQRLRRGML